MVELDETRTKGRPPIITCASKPPLADSIDAEVGAPQA